MKGWKMREAAEVSCAQESGLERISSRFVGAAHQRLQKLTLCLQASRREVHTDSNTNISEVFAYLSCTCSSRKRLHHVFVNDSINELMQSAAQWCKP